MRAAPEIARFCGRATGVGSAESGPVKTLSDERHVFTVESPLRSSKPGDGKWPQR
jgi:hypothetical protein